MRDPYSILGVAKSADEREIKSAFRKLAKQYHPDQNADNPKAQEKFAQINTAYEILGDQEKRKQFDRGEIDAEGKPTGFGGGNPFGGGFSGNPFGGGRRQSDSGGGFSAEDILSEIFGGTGKRPRGSAGADPFAGMGGMGGMGGTHRQQPSKGSDVNVTLQVSVDDLASSEKVRVQLPNGKTLSVALPAGVEDDQIIRLKGQGDPSPMGGAAGDALITIAIKSHPLFRRDGENLRLDVPITLYEAVLGGKVKVPTLGGHVSLGIPKGSNGGQTLRIKERGILKKDGSRGDILATLRIVLPEGGSADLETMMQVWQDQRPYKVRDNGFD